MKTNANFLVAVLAVLAACALALPQPASAQSLGDMLKRAVRSESERQVDQTARRIVRCAFGDDACIQAAKRSGAQVDVQSPPALQPDVADSPSSASATRSLPDDVRPVPIGPAVPLAQMQASCDREAVQRTTAARKDAPFNPGLPGSAPVLARLKAVFADFAPNGFETRTGGHLEGRLHDMPANMASWNYHVTSSAYGCLSNGKFFKDGHYAFDAYIFTNDNLDGGPYRHARDFDPDSGSGDGLAEEARFGFYTLRPDWLVDGLPQARNGYFHFSGEGQDIYWFTRSGRLPFAYVSRESFLRKQIAVVQTELAHQRRVYDRMRADGIAYDQAKQDELFDFMFEQPLARYRQLLGQPAAWLQQQAIVRDFQSGEPPGYHFLEPSQLDTRSLVPIQPDPTYLDPARAAGVPQYLVIRMKNNQRRGEYYQLRDLVERNVDTFKSLVN